MRFTSLLLIPTMATFSIVCAMPSGRLDSVKSESLDNQLSKVQFPSDKSQSWYFKVEGDRSFPPKKDEATTRLIRHVLNIATRLVYLGGSEAGITHGKLQDIEGLKENVNMVENLTTGGTTHGVNAMAMKGLHIIWEDQSEMVIPRYKRIIDSGNAFSKFKKSRLMVMKDQILYWLAVVGANIHEKKGEYYHILERLDKVQTIVERDILSSIAFTAGDWISMVFEYKKDSWKCARTFFPINRGGGGVRLGFEASTSVYP
ncbi:hypothetical protein BJ684DRAFT_17884 [Piptocephalis cylindrospora]|uniref:Uncharacterized protein n=1 Tax=Piptocephalis cylindrospora TaxID=1907219 RepID=A0A4P9XYT1_9FUNG|nr:hypothetical protein BJ684DRAFT_17884 [Piptocephalis cylindrospora]|eukprot:RKP11534.1 hypothetical protein BJ684DRAFT_17884 [Piptocephalis cylindrospora]